MGNEIEVLTGNPHTNQGCYLLRISLKKAAGIRFGAYRGGESILLPAGVYLYLGSARGEKGASSLGYRLLRHTTRTGTRPPHAIRPALHKFLTEESILSKIPSRKSLHWHIDHLLDRPEARITHILALRTEKDLEPRLADWLAARKGVSIPAPGLGASDHPGSTHLLAVSSSNRWWAEISVELSGFLVD